MPDTNTVSGGAGALFSAGADGLTSISFTPPSLLTVYQTASGFAATEAVTFGAAPVTSAGGVTTLTGSSVHNGTVVTLVVNADGSYTFTQSAPLVNPTAWSDRGEPGGHVRLHGDRRRHRYGQRVAHHQCQ